MGSMFAAAVVLDPGFDPTGLADSKKLSAKRRDALYAHITGACEYGVGIVTAEEIDSLGMARCRRLVLTRALDALARRAQPTSIVVDGQLFDAWRGVPHACFDHADARFACVSAASIVAKVSRDRYVAQLCADHPEWSARYGWASNKGYGTARHRAAMREHGACELHRRSFRLKEG